MKEKTSYINKPNAETINEQGFDVAIVCLYGFPQKADSEPFAGKVLKSTLDSRFPNKVRANIHLLGNQEVEDTTPLELATKLSSFDSTQIIGISIPQGTQELAEQFLACLKEVNYSGLIVLGHALPTYLSEKFINLFPDTLIVRGWGDKTLAEIVQARLNKSSDFSNISNLTYMDDGVVVNTPIEWPDTFGVPSDRDPQKFFPRIEASRGCHHDKCTFCTRPLKNENQKPWIRVPPVTVLKDIANLHDQGGTVFTFTDEDFFGNDLDGALQIAEGIKQIGKFEFALDLRADSILNPADDPETALQRDVLLRTLVDAGMSFVYVGAETFSKTQLKRYGKGNTPNESVASIRKMISLSVPSELGLITFDPVMTLDELSENVDMLETTGLWRYSAQLFNELHIFQGNPYSKIIERNGLITGYDENYMTYSYNYLNRAIALIRDACVPLKKEVDPVYTSARNILRTNFTVPGILDDYILHYRERELGVLKKLVQEPPTKYTEITKEARNLELQQVQKLSDDIRANGLDNLAEYSQLTTNIREYIQQFKIASQKYE